MIKVKINSAPLAALLGVKQGDVMQVASKNGVATTREWRNRIRDSEFDGCVTVVTGTTKATKEPR